MSLFSFRGPVRASHPQCGVILAILALSWVLVPEGRTADVPAPAAPAAVETPAPPPSPPQPPHFLTASTVLRLDQGEVIAFRLDQPAADKIVYPAVLDPAAQAEILQPPTVLKNQTLGYIRLRALRAGTATLKIGESTLALKIVPDELPEPKPEIVTPEAGSDVWGKIAVGVELFSTRAPTDDRTVSLRLPDGTELTPESRPGPREGSHLRFAYTVDTDRFKPGINFLTAVLKGKDGETVASRPLALNVIRADPRRLIAGACTELPAGPRAQRAGNPPSVQKDPNASAGNCVVNGNWCLPIEVDEPGYYQMIMTVRGDFGGGAFPTVGMILNEDNTPLSSVRLADAGWQRIPIGAPFRLPAGFQILTAAFPNGFYFDNKDNRKLYLDRYELLRLDGPGLTSGDAAAGAGGSMMAADSMSMTMASAPMASTATMSAAESAPAGSTTLSPEVAARARNLGQDDVDFSTTEILGPGELLHVAFDRVIDGQPVDGLVTLHARCWWQHPEEGLEPRTELKVNGVVRDVQQGANLVFRIPPDDFLPGANTVSLHASLPGGIEVEEPGQRLFLQTAVAGPARHFRRFTAVDRNWGTSLADRLKEANPGQSDWQANFTAPGAGTLALPDDLAGDFQVVVEGRPDGPIPLRVALHQGGGGAEQALTAAVGQTEQGIGSLHLVKGPKQLVLARVDDPKVAGKKYFLGALRLDETRPDAEPPKVAVLYPVNGALLDTADAVVAQPFSASGVAWADVAIDDQPLGLRLKPHSGLGRILFPIVTRDLAPGTHQLKVIAQGYDGKSGGSPAISFEVARQPAAAPALSAYARAIHLLNRFAYGPEPDELASILVDGEQVWLHNRLAESADDPGMRAADEELRVLYPDEHSSAPVRALQQLLLTPNPVRARFVMWTENHFSTWVDKVQNEPKWDEHLQFWQLGVAPFQDLLFTSATSPAMLVYLDQYHSYANKLNENYAREIMELHTLGVHGGYNQTDVTTLAGVLNGWTLSDEADLDAPPAPGNPNRVFRFDPELNDGKERQVIGMDFSPSEPADRFDRVLTALEVLAAHPSTAAFISTKLAEQYVADPPPPALVARLSQVYLSTGGDMRALLETIAASPEFWASAQSPRMTTPLDYSIRLARLTGFFRPGQLADFMKQSGAGLFDRATPDGYPETDSEYANSNSLLQRWRLARAVDTQFNDLMPADWLQPAYDWSPAHRQQLIDFTAMRLTGRLLSPASQEAATTVMEKTTAAPADRPAFLASFICQLPEANLR